MCDLKRFKDLPIDWEMTPEDAVAEKQHEKRFKELAENIEKGRVFKREEEVVWRCLNCGYIHSGSEPPETCPACDHPQGYFELLGENW